MRSNHGGKKFLIHSVSPAALFLLALIVSPAQAAEQGIFGPIKYEVRERYGRQNRYQETINAAEGASVIKLQNGERASQGVDLVEFSVNGETLLKERHYDYRYVACFVRLKRTNAFELAIRDYTPPAFKRPLLSAKNVVITIMPATIKLTNVALGVHAWEDVNDYADSLLKITSPGSSALAFTAAGLQHDIEARADAMRKLSGRKDPKARDFILSRFLDLAEAPEVRGEAALALGFLEEKAVIPALMQGMLDPDEKVRMGSARALALYKEEDTKKLLTNTLERMNSTMRPGVVRAIVSAGWRPVNALLELAGASDPDTANLGVELLIGSTDKQAIDTMLTYLENPGPRDIRLVIAALGESKDSRAIAPLSRMAGDPAKGRGIEAELGTALAKLGDPTSADLIVVMIKRLGPRYPAYHKLLEVYKKLTGMEFK